jgi:undecaprenyl-diphosphatase
MILRIRPVWPAAAAATFVLLAVLTVAGWAPLDAVDAAVSGWFRARGAARPGLIAVVRVATDVAATVPYLTAALVVTVVLAVRGRRRAAAFVAAVAVAVPALWAGMHLLLSHPRPVDGFVTVASNGFPSGHTGNATAAALVAVVLCRPLVGRRGGVLLVAGATLLAVMIGVSRLVLLAHWPSEVLGGWLLALAVVPPLAAAAGAAPAAAADRRDPTPPA